MPVRSSCFDLHSDDTAAPGSHAQVLQGPADLHSNRTVTFSGVERK